MRCCDFGRLAVAAFAGLPRNALVLGCAALGRAAWEARDEFTHVGAPVSRSVAQGATRVSHASCSSEDHAMLCAGLSARIVRKPDPGAIREAGAVADGVRVLP
jgi:hypothetical protein